MAEALSKTSAAAAVASEMEAELNCSVCLSIYRDPVALHCGHNFCWECLDKVWESQATGKSYSCPDCRAEYNQRPELQRNLKLSNIVERFQASRQSVVAGDVVCDLCLDSPLPAVKTCQNCEASLCERHLKKHAEKPAQRDHILVEPTVSLESRKCQEHSKMIEYYCSEDESCVCVTCYVAGSHRNHNIRPLKEVHEEKRSILGKEIERLQLEKKKLEDAIKTKEQDKVDLKKNRDDLRKDFSSLFQEIRSKLQTQEEKILKHIQLEEVKELSGICQQLQELRVKKELTRMLVKEAEEAKLQKDPLEFLQVFQSVHERAKQNNTEVPMHAVQEKTLPKSSYGTALAKMKTTIEQVNEELIENAVDNSVMFNFKECDFDLPSVGKHDSFRPFISFVHGRQPQFKKKIVDIIPEVHAAVPKSNEGEHPVPKFKIPEVHAPVPKSNEGEFTMLKFKMPEFHSATPKSNEGEHPVPKFKMPEVHAAVPKSNEGEFTMLKFKMPEFHSATPKSNEGEHPVPKFKMPEFHSATPKSNEGEHPVPKFKMPEVHAPVPKSNEGEFTMLKFKMPEFHSATPKSNEGEHPVPKFKMPEVHAAVPKSNEGEFTMLKFKMPEFHSATPKSNEGEHPVPKFKIPEFHSATPKSNEGEHPVPKFKIPEFHSATPKSNEGEHPVPKFKIPEVHAAVPKSNEGEHPVPKFKIPEFHSATPESNEGEHPVPKFKMPKFHFATPKSKMPEVHAAVPESIEFSKPSRKLKPILKIPRHLQNLD
ncbi:neuroblast differentiation-associated protein AHNAK-like isoform X2 [Acipenser ruthenus]|uniref:neuroblast differentiation-associated protein AHNAK-like isoform X2 n=1 Tax=Acipenser ruthenus TaxID=7906 RepID=UPI0027428565|nr:neuroblast differentiation-associated protein AHNAK-like isoform X2 [Acipenser ruthenus]